MSSSSSAPRGNTTRISPFVNGIKTEINNFISSKGGLTAKKIHDKLTEKFNKKVKEQFGMTPAKWRAAVTRYGAQDECMKAKEAEEKYSIGSGPKTLSLYKKDIKPEDMTDLSMTLLSLADPPIQVHTMIMADVLDASGKRVKEGTKFKKE